VSTRRPALALVVSVACGLLLAGCGETFRSAAAVVDGDRISDDEVQEQLDLALADPQTSAQLGTGPERAERIKEATRLTLSILIQERLVGSYARVHDIAVDPAEVDQALAQTVQDAGGKAAFEQELEVRGLTVEDVRDNLERRLLIEAVASDLASREVSEIELREAYDDRVLEFTEVHVSHILLASPDAAEAIRARATPDNFARLAREESEDTTSAASGGDLGTRRAIELPEPLAAAAVQVPIGRVSGPVQTDAGYSVFIVHDRSPIPFSEVRADLLAERQNDVFAGWLAEKVRTADIRVNPRYGRLDTATGRVVAFTTTDTDAPPEVQLTP
jgi:foldase protein PrsA